MVEQASLWTVEMQQAQRLEHHTKNAVTFEGKEVEI